MATERLSMRVTREVLRLKWVLGRSHRDIRRSTGVGLATVSETASRAEAAGLNWASVERLSDAELEVRLYPPAPGPGTQRPLPDPKQIDLELRRTGVTLRLLHVEYLERHPNGYGYTQFCHYYQQWASRRHLPMRQVHKAGEKLFVDYSGKRPRIVDRDTGEVVEVEVFVAVLGASNFTFAEATASQKSHDFIASHTRALEAIGGAPRAVVPDQLKSAVVVPSRYEPGIQRTYAEWAVHYGTAIVPARPAHPRDKAKVEAGVLVAQRWILARLRNETFFSLGELNARIAELCADLNDRVMRRYGESRRQLFDRLDRPALQTLPPARFAYADWKRAKVNIDYHVDVDHHYYSVDHSLVHEEVEARVTATSVELFHCGQRVAAYARSYERGRHTTTPEHMPKAHQKHLEWTPSRITNWAKTIGPNTAALTEAILVERTHPEQGYRSCLGILRLGKRYGSERLEAACARALVIGARSYRNVESILKSGLERQPLPAAPTTPPDPPPSHENIRGRDYYN